MTQPFDENEHLVGSYRETKNEKEPLLDQSTRTANDLQNSTPKNKNKELSNTINKGKIFVDESTTPTNEEKSGCCVIL